MATQMEAQLAHIKSKEDLHRWIDDQDDDTRMLVMADPPGGEDFRFQMLGDFTCAELVYMVELLKFDLFDHGDEDDDGNHK